MGCLSLVDPAGRRCDDSHPCAGGRLCVAGFCVASDDAGIDPVSDGGADAGIDTGIDAGVDSGIPTGTVVFEEDFEDAALDAGWTIGTTLGQWKMDFASEGTAAIVVDGTRALSLNSPTTALTPNQFVRLTTVEKFGDFELQARIKVSSFGTGLHDGAVLLWHFIDADRSYELVVSGLKWELFRRDPFAPDGQKLLESKEFNVPLVNDWILVRINVQASTMKGWINGSAVFDLIDLDLPTAGAFGLAAEQVTATFDNMLVTQP